MDQRLGIPFAKFNQLARYRLSRLIEWAEAQEVVRGPAMKMPNPGGQAGAGGSDDRQDVTANIAQPARPDNQPPAGARRGKALARALELEATLGELFPSVFDRRQPLPLAIGTSSAVAAALGEVDGRALGIFFRRWTTRWSYLKALAADGSMRHALDGSVVEPVSDDHRRHAAETLAAMREADRRPVAVDKPKPKPRAA